MANLSTVEQNVLQNMATNPQAYSAVVDASNVLTIDWNTRSITIPPTIDKLGVESDDDVCRLNFKMPKMFGEFDLSTFIIHINYMNGNKGDVYIAEDKAVSGEFITFSWLVGRNAVSVSGETTFIVCLKKSTIDGVLEKEINTTVASLKVLKGLETSGQIVKKDPDLIEQLLLKIEQVGNLPPEKIKPAVEDYLAKNPVQIVTDGTLTLANKAADAKAVGDKFGTKVDKMQGVENTGKELIVGADGNVVVSEKDILPIEEIEKFGATYRYSEPTATLKQYGILLKTEFDAGLKIFKPTHKHETKLFIGTFTNKKAFVSNIYVTPKDYICVLNDVEKKIFRVYVDGSIFYGYYDAAGNLTKSESFYRVTHNFVEKQLTAKLDKAQGAPNANKNVETDASGNVIFADKVPMPTKLPNPNALTFTGAVTGTYDGSQALSVKIPDGGIDVTPYVKIAELKVDASMLTSREVVFTSTTYPDLNRYNTFRIAYTGVNYTSGRPYRYLNVNKKAVVAQNSGHNGLIYELHKKKKYARGGTWSNNTSLVEQNLPSYREVAYAYSQQWAEVGETINEISISSYTTWMEENAIITIYGWNE